MSLLLDHFASLLSQRDSAGASRTQRIVSATPSGVHLLCRRSLQLEFRKVAVGLRRALWTLAVSFCAFHNSQRVLFHPNPPSALLTQHLSFSLISGCNNCSFPRTELCKSYVSPLFNSDQPERMADTRLLTAVINKDVAIALDLLGAAADGGSAVDLNLVDSEHGSTALVFAAELGHAQAQFNLGAMYDDGLGVKQDYTEAVEWSLDRRDLGLTPGGAPVMPDFRPPLSIDYGAASAQAGSRMCALHESLANIDMSRYEAWFKTPPTAMPPIPINGTRQPAEDIACVPGATQPPAKPVDDAAREAATELTATKEALAAATTELTTSKEALAAANSAAAETTAAAAAAAEIAAYLKDVRRSGGGGAGVGSGSGGGGGGGANSEMKSTAPLAGQLSDETCLAALVECNYDVARAKAKLAATVAAAEAAAATAAAAVRKQVLNNRRNQKRKIKKARAIERDRLADAEKAAAAAAASESAAPCDPPVRDATASPIADPYAAGAATAAPAVAATSRTPTLSAAALAFHPVGAGAGAGAWAGAGAGAGADASVMAAGTIAASNETAAAALALHHLPKAGENTKGLKHVKVKDGRGASTDDAAYAGALSDKLVAAVRSAAPNDSLGTLLTEQWKDASDFIDTGLGDEKFRLTYIDPNDQEKATIKNMDGMKAFVESVPEWGIGPMLTIVDRV